MTKVRGIPAEYRKDDNMKMSISLLASHFLLLTIYFPQLRLALQFPTDEGEVYPASLLGKTNVGAHERKRHRKPKEHVRQA